MLYLGINESTFEKLKKESYVEGTFLDKLNKKLSDLLKKQPEDKKVEGYPEGKNKYIVDFIAGKDDYFNGYLVELSHYFRHLYQLIKFVVSEKKLNLTNSEKYEYIKTIRAQLSNYEQIILFYNSFSKSGSTWWENDENKSSYFLDWRIIKNIPLDFGNHPVKAFYYKLKDRNDHQIFNKKNNLVTTSLKEKLEWSFEWDISDALDEIKREDPDAKELLK